MALSDYDKQILTASQQAQIQNLTNKWNDVESQYKAAVEGGNNALADQLARQKADLHTQAEAIRASKGYLGGVEGTDYTPVETKKVVVSTPTYDFTSAVQDNSQYLNDMYEAQKKSALASIEDAYKKNVNAVDRAGVGLAQGYQGARNQTTGAAELAKRNNAEYAAAYGLNSGTGGQMELARNVTLQNNLNTINAQEAQSTADLAMQRANAEVEYNTAIAQAEQHGNYELAASLYKEKVRVQETLLQAQIQQAQMEYQAYRDSVGDTQWQQSFDFNVGQQGWENAMNTQQYANALAQQQYENLFNQMKYENSLTGGTGTGTGAGTAGCGDSLFL